MLKLLADDDTVASVVCLALKKVIGDGWLLWEPESIWRELEHQGIEVPLGNRQQLMAARGLLIHGRYFYDGLVFDRTCAAFSNETLDIDAHDETLTMHLAWGADEAMLICQHHDDDYLQMDREPVSVVVEQLLEEGFVCAPQILSFAQAGLDARLDKSHAQLKKEVMGIWADLRGHSLRDVPYPETPKGVQLARLAGVELFLESRRAVRAKQLTQLT